MYEAAVHPLGGLVPGGTLGVVEDQNALFFNY